MVGAQTVLSDDPQLNVRLPGLEDRSPIRVVLDGRLRTPPGSMLARTARALPVWIVAAEDASWEAERALREQGVEVMRVGRSTDGRLDLRAALRLLALRGVTRVFSEGGPTVGEALAEAGLADVVILSRADAALGQVGLPAVRPGLAAALGAAERYVRLGEERHGSDVFTTFERRN